jgi:hypothetical protein
MRNRLRPAATDALMPMPIIRPLPERPPQRRLGRPEYSLIERIILAKHCQGRAFEACPDTLSRRHYAPGISNPC